MDEEQKKLEEAYVSKFEFLETPFFLDEIETQGRGRQRPGNAEIRERSRRDHVQDGYPGRALHAALQKRNGQVHGTGHETQARPETSQALRQEQRLIALVSYLA